MKIHLLAIAKLRGAMAELADEYAKRLQPKIMLRELTAPSPKAEQEALLAALPPKAFVVALDERGEDLSSRELAQRLDQWRDRGVEDLYVVIGGADGLGDVLRARASFLLGLGRKTWPHALARVMVLEQLYRAQQISAGHPYHRD
jgi:23S rRNA (pseudouridine1915-N3)-methyltransferase